MIHTVTVNPALDLTYRVPEVRFDDTVRARTVHRGAGGKGVNVSRVVTRLTHSTVAMGFAGGRPGEEVLDLLRAEEVRTWFTRHDGPTRTNAILQDDAGRQVRVSGPGPEVGENEIQALVDSVFELRVPEALVLSGSLLPGVPDDFYAHLARRATRDGVRVAVDADRELRASLAAGAAVIKPNAYELGRLVGRNVRDAESAREAAEAARGMGAEVVVCSLGAEGAVWVGPEGAWRAVPPRVEVDSALGAGDALLAGVLVGLARGEGAADALRLGVACGTATARTPGTDLCHVDDIEHIRDRIEITPMP